VELARLVCADPISRLEVVVPLVEVASLRLLVRVAFGLGLVAAEAVIAESVVVSSACAEPVSFLNVLVLGVVAVPVLRVIGRVLSLRHAVRDLLITYWSRLEATSLSLELTTLEALVAGSEVHLVARKAIPVTRSTVIHLSFLTF